MSSIKSLCRFRRCYSVVATDIGGSAEQKTLSAAKKVKNVTSTAIDGGGGGRSSSSNVRKAEAVSEEKQVFWMRDPKTGYWVPENHFDDVDVCDLRNKFLFK
ncbi:hypothetical protein Sjap_012025 [Stephania japonica]|uniref:Late embryogenesis abundant protein n=1 Tax=Stephania japonica TaxID=461633 RepID=A0AAP0JEI5_9MAGN